MENFFIEGKDLVPDISFDAESGMMSIAGESCHEYTHEFFAPVFDWLARFLQEPGRKVQLDFKMAYFNTASSKCFYEIIELLHEYQQDNGGQVTINWHYEASDMDMRETAMDYIEDSGHPVNLVAVNQI